MTSYISIANSEVDPDSPITADLMTKLRDNPIAISEGSSGAPKVSKLALGGLLLGSINSSTTTWAGITGLGSITEVFLSYSSANGPSLANKGIQIRFTNDGGTNWGTAQNLLVVTTTGQGTMASSASASIHLVSGAYSAQGMFWSSVDTLTTSVATGTLTVPTNCNGFQIRTVGSVGSASAIAFGFGGR